MRTNKETLIEAAMFIEREAYCLKQSHTNADGTWDDLDTIEEYMRENQLAHELREIAQELSQ
ncbi:hypothetical protein [Teredinibacter turnerae]|uniref:hypothetical protein n=1 Tax=Teredinibacter turnerae TaxID=2426 RepID=UPI0030D0F8CE